MEDISGHSHLSIELADSEFNTLSTFIKDNFGIKLPPIKKMLLQSRLQKRLKALHINTFNDYITYLFRNEGMKSELIHMMDVISTNKTDFFREKIHFDFLYNQFSKSIRSQEYPNMECWMFKWRRTLLNCNDLRRVF